MCSNVCVLIVYNVDGHKWLAMFFGHCLATIRQLTFKCPAPFVTSLISCSNFLFSILSLMNRQVDVNVRWALAFVIPCGWKGRWRINVLSRSRQSSGVLQIYYHEASRWICWADDQ